ncbi:hypothetical protein [Streptomyces sp. JJ38]|uniref:hypothetical protein n=1 Tax=Streptomyces sp. JJ38 TaxID=2738128 RepID=UPI00214CE4F9|nr:hypothetical protein [Streptomyces sp. JJ38]
MSRHRSTAPARAASPASPAYPDLTALPVSPPSAAGGEGFPLFPAPSGIHLGTDRTGQAVTLPAFGPRSIRVGVLGESLFGRLLACRLVATGAAVTAATRGPALWTPLQAACGERLTVSEAATAWPPGPATAPGAGPGPQALVTDLRRPPGAPAHPRAWTTVVHVTRRAPARSAHWRQPDAVLVLDAGYADAVTPVLGEAAGRLTASLAQGEIAMFRPTGADILRLDIAPAETALLRPA